jgi:hypothetical protein
MLDAVVAMQLGFIKPEQLEHLILTSSSLKL